MKVEPLIRSGPGGGGDGRWDGHWLQELITSFTLTLITTNLPDRLKLQLPPPKSVILPSAESRNNGSGNALFGIWQVFPRPQT